MLSCDFKRRFVTQTIAKLCKLSIDRIPVKSFLMPENLKFLPIVASTVCRRSRELAVDLFSKFLLINNQKKTFFKKVVLFDCGEFHVLYLERTHIANHNYHSQSSVPCVYNCHSTDFRCVFTVVCLQCDTQVVLLFFEFCLLRVHFCESDAANCNQHPNQKKKSYQNRSDHFERF